MSALRAGAFAMRVLLKVNVRGARGRRDASKHRSQRESDESCVDAQRGSVQQAGALDGPSFKAARARRAKWQTWRSYAAHAGPDAAKFPITIRHYLEINHQKFHCTASRSTAVCLQHTRAALTAQLPREQSEGCCCEALQDASSPRRRSRLWPEPQQDAPSCRHAAAAT